ncbi:MAG: glycosyltransferase [Chitinivibrionales bacterium]|nr:glycosyltransferase [Chitinivibrionales bacterium]MBD3396478.1 glycosyltransferase [Chitinivibrionales bacterium]
MFAGMLALWRMCRGTKAVLAVVILGIVARIAFLNFPHSDDVHRYIWEGRIQNLGHNPFALAPDAQKLETARDDNWEGINHKHVSTSYWPFSQMLFRAVVSAAPSPLAFKILFTLFDLGIMLLLFALMRRLNTPPHHLLLYALNPLVLVYTAGEGHLEIVVAFWLMLSMLAYAKRRYALMYVSLGLAVMTKVPAAIVVPFLVRRNNLRLAPLFGIPFLLSVPYLTDGVSFLHVPAMFAREYHYNGLADFLLRPILGGSNVLPVLACLLLITLATIFLLTTDRIRASMYALGAFLVFSTTVHPWYLLTITPFLVLYRSGPWLALHITSVALIFVFNPWARDPFWHATNLLITFEYVPFVIMGLRAMVTGNRHGPGHYGSPQDVSVVVPARNEQDHIRMCLDSIRNQEGVREILVVDGGSDDRTREIAEGAAGTRVIDSPSGRGVQIRRGAREAGGDVVLVLHADSRLQPDAVPRVIDILRRRPDVVGGSFSARYDSSQTRFRFTEFLNNLRARVFGISFGDQGQFFRRKSIADRIPPLRLMEDIELSLLIKEFGAAGFVRGGVVSSTRGWERAGYARNFLKVISLTTLYIVRRAFGLCSKDCADFERMYYGKARA